MVSATTTPVVGVIMGSRSDWETMRHASEQLDALRIEHESRVVSAHRTPELMHTYAAEAADRGLKVIIAGAGGAAHLPGMVAGMTALPVIGVPVQSRALNGLDSLLSIVQMPGGVPCATMAIGKAGAVNAALFAARILGLSDDAIAAAVQQHSTALTRSVLDHPDPTVPSAPDERERSGETGPRS
jgi:5-(carboxyamino)imidazole ribonucleotide mutase